MNSQIFYPGQLCLYDRYNFSNLKGANSILFVSIIRPYKQQRKFFRKENQWVCFVPMTQEVIVVPEYLLCPIPEPEEMGELESIIMVRNPVNLPEFTIDDMNNIEKAINLLEEHKTLYDEQATIAINNTNDIITGLRKLMIKFNFYSKMIVNNQMPFNIGPVNGMREIIEDIENKKNDNDYDENDV